MRGAERARARQEGRAARDFRSMNRVHRSVLCAGAALLSACEFCPAITCDDEVHVTLSNVAGLFASTTEPSVEVCCTEGCGWFHFTNEKGDIHCTPDDMSLESRTGCVVAGGVAQLASFGGPDDEISVSITVRGPDAKVLFQDKKTTETTDSSTCEKDCTSASVAFAIP